jgi:uncharacterized protein YcbK (DUF882 family)
METRDMAVSENFTYREVACKCREHGTLHAATLVKLERLRAMLGGHPLTIISGYRCPKHNAAVGGAADSQHTRGRAADIASSYVDLAGEEALRAMIAAGFTGIGRGVNRMGARTFHVDDGHERMTFWRYTPAGIVIDNEAYDLHRTLELEGARSAG